MIFSAETIAHCRDEHGEDNPLVCSAVLARAARYDDPLTPVIITLQYLWKPSSHQNTKTTDKRVSAFGTAQRRVRHKDAMKENEGRKSALKPGEGRKKETDDVETAECQVRCVSQQLHGVVDCFFRVVSNGLTKCWRALGSVNAVL